MLDNQMSYIDIHFIDIQSLFYSHHVRQRCDITTLLTSIVELRGWFGAGSEPRRWSAIFSCLLWSVAHDLAVDCAADAVVQLSIQLRQRIRGVYGCLREISHGSCFNNVSDNKLFDRLVLRNAPRTVCAAHGVHVTTTFLWTTSITSLLSHSDLL